MAQQAGWPVWAPPRAAYPERRLENTGPTLSPPLIARLCQVGDAVLMAFAALFAAPIFASVLLRRETDPPPAGELLLTSLIFLTVACWLISRRGGYSLPALLDPLRQAPAIAVAMAAAGASLAAAALLLHGPDGDLRHTLAGSLGCSMTAMACMMAFRLVVALPLRALRRSGRLASRVAVVGANNHSLRFQRESARDPSVRIVGVYDDCPGTFPVLTSGVVVRGSVADLAAYARSNPVDVVVIATPLDAADRIAEVRANLACLAAEIVVTADARAPRSPRAGMRMLGASWVVPVSPRPLRDWQAFQKAAFDRVCSAVLLVLLTPLLAVVAASIRLDSPGPVLLRQAREGLNGSVFTMLTFRTMASHRPSNVCRQATRGDQRVTWVGAWLRRLGLDALPQLLNVVRGDMSLVGPRPYLSNTRAGNILLSDIAAGYDARHRVKPGMTGWAQLHGPRAEARTDRQSIARVAHDLHYIQNWSFGLDIRILLGALLRQGLSRSGNSF